MKDRLKDVRLGFIYVISAIAVIAFVIVANKFYLGKPEGDLVCEFTHQDRDFLVYIDLTQYWTFDDYFYRTSNLPKRATDSIYNIQYTIYEDVTIRYNRVDMQWIYPWDIKEHPTDYVVRTYKEHLDKLSHDKKQTERFLNYLKCNHETTD